MRSGITIVCCALLLGTGLSACSSDDKGGDAGSGDGNGDRDGDGDGEGEGATTSTSKEIGPQGGEITLGNMTLTIPENALSEPVEIEVTAREPTPADWDINVGSAIYTFEPHDLEFDKAAELLINDLSSDLFIYTGDLGGRRHPLETDPHGAERIVSASIYHFSSYWAEYGSDDSFCPRRDDGDTSPSCHLTGTDNHLRWGITELGVGKQPNVSILYTNMTEELVIVEWFEVKDGFNVSTNVFEDERVDDYSTADGQLIRPTNYGTSAWRTNVKNAKEDRKDFWRYHDLPHWVAPADDSEPMSFTFCLGYRLAGGPTEPEFCATYGKSGLGCGETCQAASQCADGLTCWGSSCAPTECDSCAEPESLCKFTTNATCDFGCCHDSLLLSYECGGWDGKLDGGVAGSGGAGGAGGSGGAGGTGGTFCKRDGDNAAGACSNGDECTCCGCMAPGSGIGNTGCNEGTACPI